ncbi:hypothetical protein BJ742DRAFT_201882 [Cladochytrium replicatum]|nr:hypothetical protein BJ742DRAFT_201882 [Cladochytrium replicatum]
MAIGALQSLCSRSNASSAVEGYDMNMGVELEQHLLKHVPLHGLHFVPIAIDALSKPLPVDSIYSISRMVMWLHTNLNSEQLVDLGSAIIVAIVDALLINISEPKSFGYCFEAIQELLLANKYMTTMVVKALVATVGQNMTPNDGNLSSEALSRTAGALRVVRQLILDNVPLANEVGSKPDSIADLRTLIQAWKSFASEETKHNALTDVTSIEKYLTRVSKNVS